MSAAAVVRQYYRTIDNDEYEILRETLAPAFVHTRPDQTLDGRATFVKFMRDQRPLTDTTHVLDTVIKDGETVAAEGRLLDPADEPLFGFVDVHELTSTGDRIKHIRTYTD